MGLSPADHANRYAGLDVYVVGSGPTLNFLPDVRGLLDGKCVVSVNHGVTRLGVRPTYVVTKYWQHAHEYLLTLPGVPVVVTRHNMGNAHSQPLPDSDRMIVIDHGDNECERWNGTWPDEGQFVATWSTSTTAMHWAAHLGARNIILLGCDAGFIDDSGRIPGYRDSALMPGYTPGDTADSGFWPVFDRQAAMVKAELLARYEGLANVVSLLPFVSANMEGHRWSSHAGTLNG